MAIKLGVRRSDLLSDIKLKFLFFTLRKELSGSFCLVEGDKQPTVKSMAWDKSTCSLGDKVNYQITVENVYRDTTIQGRLSIDILYTYFGGSALDSPKGFGVILSPGEVQSYQSVFTPPDGSGYILSCKWNDGPISDESVSLQRLFVNEGTVSLMDVYWEVNGNKVSSANIRDYVNAHVVLKASLAGVSDYVTVTIRKDIA